MYILYVMYLRCILNSVYTYVFSVVNSYNIFYINIRLPTQKTGIFIAFKFLNKSVADLPMTKTSHGSRFVASTAVCYQKQVQLGIVMATKKV